MMGLFVLMAAFLEKPKGLPITSPSSALATILQIVFELAGAIAFLMIVYAGFSYVSGQGDPDKVKKSRNTIIYAAVGLVIAVIADTIVRVFIKKII